MSLDIETLGSWIGRSETRNDLVVPTPVQALGATLDREDVASAPGDALAPAWHWLYFLPTARQCEIGTDGHPMLGGFLPSVPLPRRMWAGGRLRLLQPLRMGQAVQRISRIADVRLRHGRSGPLVFVSLSHDIRAAGALAIHEEQDIVYRDMPSPGEPQLTGVVAPTDAQWTRRIVPNEVLLFRYSALTFNGHRIHYDRAYATQVEHYPGLVVHGPLIATLLLDLLRRQLPGSGLQAFDFRAVAPLFDLHPFLVCGRQQDARTVRLWACAEDGRLAMDATATLA